MVKGWFNDTVFTAPVDRIALLRLDGDLYTSTMDVLEAFYHKVPAPSDILDAFATCRYCFCNLHAYIYTHTKNSSNHTIILQFRYPPVAS